MRLIAAAERKVMEQKEILSTEGSRWRSVKDNPPDAYESVICLGTNGGMFIGRVAASKDGTGIAYRHGGQRYRITHWMPRPVPPEGWEPHNAGSRKRLPDCRCDVYLKAARSIQWLLNREKCGSEIGVDADEVNRSMDKIVDYLLSKMC